VTIINGFNVPVSFSPDNITAGEAVLMIVEHPGAHQARITQMFYIAQQRLLRREHSVAVLGHFHHPATIYLSMGEWITRRYVHDKYGLWK